MRLEELICQPSGSSPASRVGRRRKRAKRRGGEKRFLEKKNKKDIINNKVLGDKD